MPDEETNNPLQIWKKAFRLTYQAELRAERISRPEAIVDSDPERYRRFAEAAGFLEKRSFTGAQRCASE